MTVVPRRPRARAVATAMPLPRPAGRRPMARPPPKAGPVPPAKAPPTTTSASAADDPLPSSPAARRSPPLTDTTAVPRPRPSAQTSSTGATPNQMAAFPLHPATQHTAARTSLWADSGVRDPKRQALFPPQRRRPHPVTAWSRHSASACADVPAANGHYLPLPPEMLLLLRTCIISLRLTRPPPDPRWRVVWCFSFLFSHSLVRLLTFVSTTCPEFRLTFGGGPCFPLPPIFLLRSFCLHIVSYFLHSTAAYLRNCAQNTVSFLRSLNPQLRHRRH